MAENLTCRIHPVVIFNILDHYMRRNDDHRSIGTLVGYIHDGIVEIRNSFPVPHTEGQVVAVDNEAYSNFYSLHRRVSPKDIALGWYSAGSEINHNSILINEFYAQQKQHNYPPIHLTVDTTLSNYKLSINCYTSTNVVLNEKKFGTQFLPLSYELLTFEAEQLGLDIIAKSASSKNGQASLFELQNLETTIKKLHELLGTITEYVNQVLQNQREPNNEIGRFLANAVAALPKIEPAHLEKMFNHNLQDLLMVVYLANLTRTQLRLAEKLQKTL